MNWLTKRAHAFDKFQQRHKLTAFLVAVFKKYSDDQAGTQAALLTYYAFVSLFPLLLVFFTFLGLAIRNDPSLQERVLNAVLQYFPIAAPQLANNIQAIHHNGIAIVGELIIILYGARGIAGALQNACNHLWRVPADQRPGFPKNLLHNFAIMIVGGLGLVLSVTGLSYATSIGHSHSVLNALTVLAALVLNFGMFLIVFRLATANHVPTNDLMIGALFASFFWIVLQGVGSFLILHQFRQSSPVYGLFALVLVMLFWFYLQAQITLYAIEINVVRVRRLWPKALFESNSQ